MRFDQRAQLKELGQRCIEGHCVSVNAIFKVSVIHKCLALAPSPPSTPYLPLALRSPPSQKAHASQWAQAQANRYTTVASSPTLHVHAVRKVCSGNTTPGVDPLIIAVLHRHAAHKIHVNAVFEGAAGAGRRGQSGDQGIKCLKNKRCQTTAPFLLMTIRAIGVYELRNRVYIANAQIRLHENRRFSRILGA